MEVQEHSDDDWEATEGVLQRLKHSCFAMHMLYRRRFFESKKRLAYYDVPIIGLSAMNSVLIAGGKDFIPQQVLQVLTCFLAVIVGIIQSIKNYFKIDENRENCLVTFKDLFKLFCELSIMLDQPRFARAVDPKKFTIDKGNEYQAIMSKAILLEDNRSKMNPIYEDTHPYIPHVSGISRLFRGIGSETSSKVDEEAVMIERGTSMRISATSVEDMPIMPDPRGEDET